MKYEIYFETNTKDGQVMFEIYTSEQADVFEIIYGFLDAIRSDYPQYKKGRIMELKTVWE